MGTSLIESKKNGYDPNRLTDQQRMFVLELLASENFSAKDAAEKAGYKHPSQAANKLLKIKGIQRALGKAQREREERCELSADDVLNYLKNVLYFNPLHYFKPSKDGKWLISDIDSLPEWVGRLIDGMKVKVVEDKEGAVTSEFEVTLVSKATALTLAMKHVSVERSEVNVNLNTLPWDHSEMYKSKDTDPVQKRIEEAKS